MNKIYLVLPLFVVFLFSCTAPNNDQPAIEIPEPQPEVSSLIINLTSDPVQNPHGPLMGLHLGQQMIAKGLNVTIFLNVNGVKLFTQEAKSVSFHNEVLMDVLRDIINQGGTVLSCPHCMEVNNILQEDLPEGVQVSNPDILSEKIKEQNTVFTY